jgi:hypothetical protein
MRAWSVILCFVMLAVVSGCKSKVTQENYDKIVEGMTLKEVEHFLGEGKQQGDGSGVAAQVGIDLSAPPGGRGQEFVWESDTKKITATFVNGTLTKKTKSGF